MIWTLTTICFWITSLVMLPGYANGFWMPKTVAWLAGGLSIIALNWVNSPSRLSLKNPWVGAGFFWVSFLFIWMTLWSRLFLPQTLAMRVRYVDVTSPLIPTLVCWISLLVIDSLVRHTDSVSRWARMGVQICLLAGGLSLYGLSQHFGLDPFQIGPRSHNYNISDTSLVTTFGNPMLTANFLAVSSPLCLVFKAKWCRMVFALILLDLLLIGSSISLLAFLLSSVIICAYRKQWVWVGLIGAGSLIGVIALLHQHALLNFFSLSHRQTIWKEAWMFWMAHPLQAWCGFGLGSVEAMTTNGVWPYGSLHCEPLQILFETGIVGFVLMAGWLWHVGRRVWRMEKTTLSIGWIAAACAYLVISLASFPLRIGSLLMLGVLIAAALEALTQEEFHAKVYAA